MAGTISDSQFELEYNYDEDFDDDLSADDNNKNDDHDSGMEVLGRHGYDTDTDNEITTKPKTHTPSSSSSSSKYTKKSNTNNSKFVGKDKTSLRSSDPYNTYMVPTSSRRAQSDPHNRKPKKPTGGNKGASARSMLNNSTTTTHKNVAMKRVLSASRKKASSLHNIIFELQQQCEALSIENRDLKRNVRVQDRDLRKLDGAEAQLPTLMTRHSNEMNVLQDKYKRQKEISTGLTENIKRVDTELLKTKDKLKEYQSMIKEKNLGERIELRNTIFNLEKVVDEKESKILELNRNITLQKKTHSRIVKEKNEKYEKVVHKVKDLKEVQNDLVSQFKDREKALEVNNIYSRRKQKDGKQIILFSPQDSIVVPSPLKGREESPQLTQRHLKSLFTENNEEDTCSVKSLVGERVDTMVNKNIIGQEALVSEHTEKIGTTFLTEGKLKMEESDDFYNINDGKEISIRNKDNISPVKKEKSSTNKIDINFLGEEELHEKLDQMNKKRNKNETAKFMNNYGEQVEEVSHGIDGETGGVFQLQLEKTVETMEILEKDHVRVNDELAEEAKARKLLLAKMQAIDKGENPNEVTESSLIFPDKTNKKSKPNKKPIFLESSPRSSPNKSEKSLDALFNNSNPKLDSGNSKHRRVRQVPESHSGNEEDSSYMKAKERKDSWEFKKTDENLHKGLPSQPAQTTRNNGLPNNVTNATKNQINSSKYEDDYNTHGRYSTNYSPTVVDTNTGQNRRTSKKDGVNLFDQFEDPFKNEPEYPKSPSRKNDEPTELFSRSNTNSQTPDPVVVDDLEEMFIL